MTTEHEHHEENCLMCAVRALTVGTPTPWRPENPGDEINGVIVAKGTLTSEFAINGSVPYWDLWLGGQKERIRVTGWGMLLRREMADRKADVGDTVSVRFDGMSTVRRGKYAGREYRAFTVKVRRGH
jgi:hypothetical protein